MKTVIAGGTGLIGKALCRRLLDREVQVTVLTRSPDRVDTVPGVRYVRWGKSSHEWYTELDGADTVVNLAGENMGSTRWSHKRKHELLQSRVETGNQLVQAIDHVRQRPIQFIQASAVGIYGTSLLATFDESAPTGKDTLAGIAQLWEDSSLEVENYGIIRTIIRTGIVLDAHEGALARMLLPYRLFAGGPIGSGRQWMSWIHLSDHINAILHIITHHLDGIFNLTAPNPVRNREFGLTIAETLSRPYWFPVPAFALRLAFGEMSVMVLEGQKVVPARLLETGFEFQFPHISLALKDVLKPEKVQRGANHV